MQESWRNFFCLILIAGSQSLFSPLHFSLEELVQCAYCMKKKLGGICYGATGKTVNTWNISRMFIVLRPITARSGHASQPQNQKLISVLKGWVAYFSSLKLSVGASVWNKNHGGFIIRSDHFALLLAIARSFRERARKFRRTK